MYFYVPLWLHTKPIKTYNEMSSRDQWETFESLIKVEKIKVKSQYVIWLIDD